MILNKFFFDFLQHFSNLLLQFLMNAFKLLINQIIEILSIFQAITNIQLLLFQLLH
jgi:hypothetical protein